MSEEKKTKEKGLLEDSAADAQDRQGLVKKLSKVMGELDAIPKNGWNDYHKYKYLREEDLLEAIRPRLAEHGIFIHMEILSVDRIDRGADKDPITRVQVKYTIYDSESDAKLQSVMIGEGADGQDKGIYKALAGAEKYFLMKNFMVSGGESDPEYDSPQDQGGGKKPQGKKSPSRSKSADSPQLTLAELRSKVDALRDKEFFGNMPPENMVESFNRVWAKDHSKEQRYEFLSVVFDEEIASTADLCQGELQPLVTAIMNDRERFMELVDRTIQS